MHDLKPFQGLVNKIKHDIGSTSKILDTIAHDYDRKDLIEYVETFKTLQIEVDLLTDTYQSIYKTLRIIKYFIKTLVGLNTRSCHL